MLSASSCSACSSTPYWSTAPRNVILLTGLFTPSVHLSTEYVCAASASAKVGRYTPAALPARSCSAVAKMRRADAPA